MIHTIHPALSEKFGVALVGAGGSGSQMLTCLARLHHAITALGHPGFRVTVYDPDIVSDANVGRQMFAPADVGQPKANVLVHRINQFFGITWGAIPERIGRLEYEDRLVISCVDTRASRRELNIMMQRRSGARYLLDLGNRAADGQVLLGQYQHADQPEKYFRPPGHTDLPRPYDLLPELIDSTGAEDDTPSCSLAEALERQELFVNDDVTRAASLILWNLLRHGQISWHGAFVNCLTGRRSPLPVDPSVWDRMKSAARLASRTRKSATATKPTARRKQ